MDNIRPLPFIAIILLALCSSGVVSVAAQDGNTRPTPTAAPSQQRAQEASAESADLAITATVSARELRFEVTPNPKVEFTGKPERKTEWSAERTNLPQRVQPGVTYRDIGVSLKIVSVFADIERIVAEALGEMPMTDDAAPSPQPSTEGAIIAPTRLQSTEIAAPQSDSSATRGGVGPRRTRP